MSLKYEPSAQVCVACADVVFLIHAMCDGVVFSSSLLLSSLELSDTQVYEPYIRARLGTAAKSRP